MKTKFQGLLLKESLVDETVLSLLDIVKTETWDMDNASSDQPNVWHALYFEGNESQADEIAGKLSQSLKVGQWYTNFSTSNGQVYIIFPNKLYTYKKGDKSQRDLAIEYGRSIHIPESQLDWEE